MLTSFEVQRKLDRQARERVLKAAQPPTPGHSAAAAANEYAGDTAADADAERRRSRLQHEVDPYLHEAPEVDHVDLADLGKRYNQAFEVEFPGEYPPLRRVDAEQFRKGPVTAGHAADSPGYGPPGRPVPIPSATLAPGMASRPLLADGQSRPCAPEAC